MPPRRRAAAQFDDDGALFVVTGDRNGSRRPGRRRTGRHERALDRSVRELKLDSARDAAGVSAARAVAAQLDEAEAAGDSYATAQLVRPYRELLTDLGILRAGGGESDDDPFAGLGQAAVVDPEDS